MPPPAPFFAVERQDLHVAAPVLVLVHERDRVVELLPLDVRGRVRAAARVRVAVLLADRERVGEDGAVGLVLRRRGGDRRGAAAGAARIRNADAATTTTRTSARQKPPSTPYDCWTCAMVKAFVPVSQRSISPSLGCRHALSQAFARSPCPRRRRRARARGLRRSTATRPPRRSTRRSATCPRTRASPSSPRPTSTTTASCATCSTSSRSPARSRTCSRRASSRATSTSSEQIEPLLGNEVVIGVDDNASFVDGSDGDAVRPGDRDRGRRQARGARARTASTEQGEQRGLRHLPGPGGRHLARDQGRGARALGQRGDAQERAQAARRGRPPDRGRRRGGVRGPARGRASSRRT